MLGDMKEKKHYHVLAVYSLEHKSGREHFSGLMDEMSRKNWRLSTVRPGRYFSCGELVNEYGETYDGLILSMPGTDDVMERIARSDIPTVLINIADRRISARHGNFAAIWSDNADIGRRAAFHLLERGEFKSAGYVHWYSQRFYSDERLNAFRQTMKRAGHETEVFPGADFGDGREYLRRWLRGLPKPAALMASTDMRAAEIINICREEGIAVPSQVAVIGADNDVSQHGKCGMSISSVTDNARLLGRQAVRELDFLFRHPKWEGRPHEVVIPAGEVFVGESTARSVSAAHLVKMAGDYIAENLGRNISPVDVVAHLGCSRSLAELRFSQMEGKTIRKAIEDVRLDEVRRRIGNGETVGSIVKSMQFTSANQLYRIYKRHFGCTMVRKIRSP